MFSQSMLLTAQHSHNKRSLWNVPLSVIHSLTFIHSFKTYFIIQVPLQKQVKVFPKIIIYSERRPLTLLCSIQSKGDVRSAPQ